MHRYPLTAYKKAADFEHMPVILIERIVYWNGRNPVLHKIFSC